MSDTDSPVCAGCGVELMPDTATGAQDWQWYMVWDSVWAQAGMAPKDGCLCLGCLKHRLGRPVTVDDLQPGIPVNEPGRYDDTPELVKLKTDTYMLYLDDPAYWDAERARRRQG